MICRAFLLSGYKDTLHLYIHIMLDLQFRCFPSMLHPYSCSVAVAGAVSSSNSYLNAAMPEEAASPINAADEDGDVVVGWSPKDEQVLVMFVLQYSVKRGNRHVPEVSSVHWQGL